jgi:hypothetical protein
LGAGSLDHPQILDPQIELGINAAERTLPRQRQIHLPQKIKLHFDYLKTPTAFFTANYFFKNFVFGFFDVVG